MSSLLEGRHIKDERPRVPFEWLADVLPQALHNVPDAAMQLLIVVEQAEREYPTLIDNSLRDHLACRELTDDL
jgi:hypothetical protein